MILNFDKNYKTLNIFKNKTKDFILLEYDFEKLVSFSMEPDIFLMIYNHKSSNQNNNKNDNKKNKKIEVVRKHHLKFGRLIFVPQLMILN